MPRYAWLGVALLVVGQLLTLVHVQPLCEYWYGIVWCGFIALADALVYARSGRSLIMNRRRDFILMFAISAIGWWGFELANMAQLNSWSYSASPTVPPWLQRLRSTFFFSTLTPATWEAMLLVLCLPWARRPLRHRPLPLLRYVLALIGVMGIALLIIGARLRSVALLCDLLAALFILDVVNYLRRVPSFLAQLEKGDARLPIGLCGSALFAGVLGEMWNYPALPKWTYHVDYIDFAHVFEMPLLGYLGYPLLAMVLFSMYHFAASLLPGRVRRASTDPEDALSLSGL